MSKVRFSNGIVLAVASLICLLFLKAYVLYEEEKLAGAERRRIECLDQFCEGDVYPKFDTSNEELLKIYGQWYVGPKKYFVQQNTAQFFWPLKQRSPPGSADDEGDWDLVEIFLTGRQRWPDPKIPKPWLGKGWDGLFKEIQQEGWRNMDYQQIRPDLERIRFFDDKGNAFRYEFYLATQLLKPLGISKPGIGCEYAAYTDFDFKTDCTGGFFWREDIYIYVRFPDKYAGDWPAIYQEIIRVLSLLRKVSP